VGPWMEGMNPFASCVAPYTSAFVIGKSSTTQFSQTIPKSLDSLRHCMQFIYNGIKNINITFRKDRIERLHRRKLSWYNYSFKSNCWSN